MRSILRNTTLKFKLIFMIISVNLVILASGSVIFFGFHFENNKDNFEKIIQLNAKLISDYCVVPLTFGNAPEVENALSRLGLNPIIVEGKVWDANMNLYGTYGTTDPEFSQDNPMPVEYYRYGTPYAHIMVPVQYEDQVLGYIYLRASTIELTDQARNDILFFLSIILGLTLIGIILAYWLQGIISKPILHLASMADNISNRMDYSVRVKKQGDDEIGVLFDSFNDLLHKLEAREIDMNRAKHDLMESERKYRAIVQDQTEFICRMDRNLNFVFTNNAFCRMTGQTEEALAGQNLSGFVHEKYRDKITPFFSGFSDQEPQKYFEYSYTDPDNREVWQRWSYRALMDSDGLITGFQGVGQDITDVHQLEAEKKNQQVKLIQADKMASIGLLATGITHEINNPNNIIKMNSSFLLRIWNDWYPQFRDDLRKLDKAYSENMDTHELLENFKNLFEAILRSSNRIENIVNQLKNFTRKTSVEEIKPENVNQLMQSAYEIAKPLLRKSTSSFEIIENPDLPRVQANYQKLEQVIINLLTNACQALENRSQKIVLSAGQDSETGHVIISVKDEGKGISPDNMKKLFDPFFTTKEDIGGTGLGLSVSYGIIQDIGGDIIFESGEGKGTLAKIILLPSTEEVHSLT